MIYFFAWKRASRNDYTISLILLMLGGIVLRLYTAADLYLHPWDERYHALVAKHLMSHPLLPTLYEHPVLPFDYTSWTSNHVWVHKQPLPLWTMAISMSVFGVNELALRLPSVVLSTIGIGLTFFIASYIFSKKLAWLAAFFFSINGLIIE
ncbi:MAG: glycosyltransferase family 39 protein [Bacteroidia bacterium]|nr:glycosyltransferase family 39 protein [Bacteroidia bacterium]